MSARHQAYFFDLDGTLIETAPEIADALNDTLRDLGWPPVSQDQVNAWIGHGTRALLAQAIAWVSHTALADVNHSASFAEALPVFDRHYQARCGSRSTLYPQVRETLQALRAQGCKLAVITNKEGRYTDTILRQHALDTLFDRVVSGDTFAVKKPDPTSVIDCLTHWGVAADAALFVGDSHIDAATARRAGIAVWLLPYGYNMGQPVQDCQPDRVIEDLSALL